MKTLCAIRRCRNKAPGRVLLYGPHGGRRVVTRNVCPSCIERIQKKYGI